MTELSKVLTDLATAIVDHPESVSVTETEGEGTVVLELHVAEDDMGKVIGRHGRIAHAIRMVMKAAGTVAGKKVTVEIR